MLALVPSVQGQFQSPMPQVIDEQATMADRLGEKAVLDGSFVDERGRPVTVAELMSGDRPLVLNLGYFGCPGMCGFVLNSLLRNVTNGELVPGTDFDLVTVSIADSETPELALDKKATYIDEFEGEAWADRWHLLTTKDPETIQALTASVGWRFRKNPVSSEYDHPPTVVVISPTGVVSRYLDARYLTPKTLSRALVEAGDGTVGNFVERLLVSCLTYDSRTGAYTVTAMTVMRIGGGVTVLALGILIYTLWRRERQRSNAAATAA